MVNKSYSDAVLLKAHDHFTKAKPQAIQLHSFLSPEEFHAVQKQLQGAWEEKIIPHQHSYVSYSLTPKLQATFKTIMTALEIITAKTWDPKITIKMFGHRDYTVLLDKKQKSGTYAFLEFCSNWDKEWGGSRIFIQKEEVLRTSPSHNAISIIQQTPLMKHFIKYINHKAERNRFIVIEFYQK